MKTTKTQKGITLVALIITIVVLLILAVVTINAVKGDGIIQYAKNARNDYEQAATNEQAMLDSYINKIEHEIKGSIDYDMIMKSIAHRGYSRVAPENTIPAYSLAKEKGFKYVETDVRATSDGVLVLLHDASINRVARNLDGSELTETINIADITYEEALNYDFGIWKSDEYAGTKITKFEDFVDFCKSHNLTPYIEIKTFSEEDVQNIVNIVNDNDIDATYLGGFGDLQKVKNYDDTSRLCYVVDDVTNTLIEKCKDLMTGENEIFIVANISKLTPEGIAFCKESNIPLGVYTVNSSDIIIKLDDYISEVTSDYLHAGKIIYQASIEPETPNSSN